MAEPSPTFVPSSRTKAATVLTTLQSLHTTNGNLKDPAFTRRASLPAPESTPQPRPPHPHVDVTSAATTPHLAPPSSYYALYLQRVGLLNSLLVFGPPALLLRVLHAQLTVQFFFACFAIVPLAGFLGEATEQLSDKLGPGTGGLLNATFGNAAELIIASFSVFRGLDTLVKSSLVGSIIGNLLLVLGGSILFGGIRFASQSFSINAANIDSNMCMVATIGFLVPSMFHSFNASDTKSDEHKLSLGISTIFLCTYLFMLFFQLKTHSYFFAKQVEVRSHEPSPNICVDLLLRAHLICSSHSFCSRTRPRPSASACRRLPQRRRRPRCCRGLRGWVGRCRR